MKEIPLSEFRRRCAALIKEVQMKQRPLRITLGGKPVAEILPVPPDPPNDKRDWLGSMTDMEILGDIVSPASDESDWEVLRCRPVEKK
jgi:prevent-host-death family protein